MTAGPALLREIGVALYGPYWQAELARKRGVARQTVHRWDRGLFPIPAGIWLELREDVRDRQDILSELMRRVSR